MPPKFKPVKVKKEEPKKTPAKGATKPPAKGAPAKGAPAKGAPSKSAPKEEKKERKEGEPIPWAEIDWTKKDEILTLFPKHEQEKIALARAKNVSKTVDLHFSMKQPFSSNYLLSDAHLFLEPGKRICLVGDASCGKSTMLEQIASGTLRDFPKHLHVHHCQELHNTAVDVSVIDAVVLSHEFRNVLLKIQKELKSRIDAKPAPANSKLEAMQANLDFVEFNLVKIKSDDAYVRAAKMLRVLGFDDVGQRKSTNSLSGGLRMRVALCAAFFIEADLLLLDEPTNHLDFPSVLWLENRLRGYRGSYLLISHDRELLENVCTSIIHFAEKKLTNYNMGFAEFEKKRAVLEKKREIEIEKFLQANRNVDPSTPRAKEKADKMAWRDAYQAKMILYAGKFTFPDAVALAPLPDDPPNPKDISLIKITDVRFSYDEKKGLPFIFDTPINLDVTCSTRMGVMGPNGAGKSTLLKLLTKRLIPVSGSVVQHPTATIAYFAQHHAAELNMEQTPIDYMCGVFPEAKAALLRQHLGKVGIIGPMAETRMKALSHGQRSCVIFAKITWICPHLLIMDEPTNFLDLESVDSLIAATNKYTGALLLVSHNRGFLKKCARQYLSVVPGAFNVYDDLKACERATYSFIAELEDTGGAGKIGASALANAAKAGKGAAGLGGGGGMTTGADAPAEGKSEEKPAEGKEEKKEKVEEVKKEEAKPVVEAKPEEVKKDVKEKEEKEEKVKEEVKAEVIIKPSSPTEAKKKVRKEEVKAEEVKTEAAVKKAVEVADVKPKADDPSAERPKTAKKSAKREAKA
jgi:ATP-binding cassette subfamily F protein 3